MSGAFSVPFVALAAWSDAKWWRVIWAVMAVLAFLLSSFLVWRKERLRVIELETAAAPRIRIDFEPVDPFVCEQIGTDFVRHRCFRIRVKNIGQSPLGSCKVQVVRAITETGNDLVTIAFSLQRSGSGNETFPLRPNEEKYVDFVAVPLAQDRPVKVAAFGEQWLSLAGTTLPREACTLTISALSEAPATEARFRFEQIDGEWGLRLASAG